MYKTIAAKALEKLLHDQKWIVQRKDSVTLFLVSVVWLASLLTPYLIGFPVWVGAAVGGVASIAGILLVALTKGAITPSMVTRAEAAAQEIGAAEAQSPVAPQAPVVEEYVGEHRAPETEPHGGIAEHYVNG